MWIIDQNLHVRTARFICKICRQIGLVLMCFCVLGYEKSRLYIVAVVSHHSKDI